MVCGYALRINRHTHMHRLVFGGFSPGLGKRI